MNASDLRKRAIWLDAVALNVRDVKKARHLSFCARAMAFRAARLDGYPRTHDAPEMRQIAIA